MKDHWRSIKRRLSALAAVCLLAGLNAQALQVMSRSGGGSGYWVFVTTPATEDRPLIGIGDMGGWESGNVQGSLFLDVPDQKYRERLRFDIIGANTEAGKLDITLRVFLPWKDEKPTGPEVLKGRLIKRLQAGRVAWAGTVAVINRQAFMNRLDPGALQQSGLPSLPERFSLEMIGFQHLYVGFGEAGLEQTEAKAIWPAERDREAQEWLKTNGIDFKKGHLWNRDHVWELQLPALNQNLTVYRMLRSGIFEEVSRSIQGAGPGQAYSVTCLQSAVFKHLPETPDGAEESLAFVRKFITDLASLPRFQGVRFGDPVVVRTHRLRFSMIGPSPAVSNGPRGYWEHFVLGLSFYREFGEPAGV